jgi:hypothetical protein
VQSDPEDSAAEHERKSGDDQKQGNALRVYPWKGLTLLFGIHHEITNDSTSSAVMATSATMITSSDFLTAGFMATGGA